MAREFARTQRVADFLKQELAGLIQLELRDPRIGMVSVTGVEVSRDMSHAKVFVTVLGKDSEADAAESVAALNHAAGFLRTQVAKINNARITPKLRFVFDASIGRGAPLRHRSTPLSCRCRAGAFRRYRRRAGDPRRPHFDSG